MTAPETALIDVLAGRAATYALLARFFRSEADEEFLGALRASRFPAHTGVPAADRGYRLIVSYLSHAPADGLTELAIDYTRTFIGAGNDGFSAAYPFESVYTSPKRLMMQDARDEVLTLYRAAGLEKLETWKEGEDHLAFELEFMEILVERSREALEAGDEERAIALLLQQRNFLADHLASWVPVMTLDVRKFANTDLYRGLAALTDGLLAIDGAFLADAVADDADDAVVGD